MGFVTSLLAVLVLLIVLATLTTAFVETLHALLKQRVNGLRHMLQAYFEDNLSEAEAKGSGLNPVGFAEQIMTNPAVSKNQKESRAWYPFINFGNVGRLDRLDAKTFIQQLANSEVGEKIAAGVDAAGLAGADLAGAKTALGERLDQLVAQFERFGDAATEIFKRRAALYAPVLGIGLAAFMNVDGALVTKRLFSDQQLAENVVVTYKREELEKLLKDARGTEIELKAAQAKLEGLGLPIGARYFPYCSEGKQAAMPQAAGAGDTSAKPPVDPRCAAANAETWAPYGGWLLSIIITGVLIGLGAPFWFDIYKKIAGLGLPGLPEAVRKAITPVPSKADAEADSKAVKPTADELVEIFLNARPKKQ